MARLHLFEHEDQSWFPAVVRDAGTAHPLVLLGMLLAPLIVRDVARVPLVPSGVAATCPSGRPLPPATTEENC